MAPHKLHRAPRMRFHNPGVLAAPPCPLHTVGKRIEDRHGRTVYRFPGYRVVAAQVKCSGTTVSVLFHGGVASSQEARRRAIRRRWPDVEALLSERYFGVRHLSRSTRTLGRGRSSARTRPTSLAGAPRGRGTVSLTVTLDGGRHFRRYRVPKLTGFQATGIRVVGHNVTITAKSRLSTGRRRRTVTVEIR
jgi:hypothetical protein